MPPVEPAPKRFFSTTQERLVGTALALLSFTVIIMFTVGVFFVFKLFVGAFYHVIWPLAVAGILATILRPVAVFLQRKLKLSRVWSILLLYLVVALAIFGLLGLLLPKLIEELLRFIDYLPVFIEDLRASFANAYPAVIQFIEEKFGAEYIAQMRESASNMAGSVMKSWEGALAKAGSFLSGAIAVATGLAIIPVYLFFLLESNRSLTRDLRKELYFVREDWRDDVVFLIDQFVGSIVSFFRGQLIIALIMGTLLAIGFASIGLNFAIVLGLAIGLLNVVPYLGSVIGLATVLPISYFQEGGGLTLVLLALGVFVVVQMIEGYFLTPRIMGRTTGLHPMLIIVAIFFWGTALDGVLGMILAIPLTAFFVVAWRLIKRKYLDRARFDAPNSNGAPIETQNAP